MRYVSALDAREQETEAFRIYVTDSLRLSGEGKYIAERYIDLLRPPRETNAKEIIDDVITRGGLEVTNEPS